MTREQFAKQFTSPLPNAILKKFPDGNLRQYWAENPNLYSSAFGHNSMYQQYCCGHSGIDIATFHRDAIVSAHDGYVHAVKLDRETLGGICVWIRSPHFENGEGYVITAYGHLDECVVKTGDEVKAGQLIGYEGNTGFVVSGATQYWGNAPAGVGCYDKETEVLTDSGWKYFKDLNKTEMIATLNPKTRQIEYQKPTGYISYFYETLLKYKNNNIDFLLTDNHNMAGFGNDYESNNLRLVPLNKITNKFYIPTTGIWIGEEKNYFELPSVVKYNHDSKYNTKPIRIKMDDWLEYLGWFFSDGSWHNKKQKNGAVRYLASICQSYSNDKKRNIIALLLNKLPFRYWMSCGKKSKAVNFVIFNKQLVSYLEQFGKGENKRLPDFIGALSPRQIKIFLNSFHLGDGYISPNGHKEYYPGLSKIMAGQLQELILKTGNHADIKLKKLKSGNNMYTVSEKTSKKISIKKRDIKRIKYNDLVYCVEVPNHIMYVRRNGTPFWCGNTHLHFGVVEYLASGEPRYPNCMMNSSDPMLYITYKNPDYSGVKILLSNMMVYLKFLLERSQK